MKFQNELKILQTDENLSRNNFLRFSIARNATEYLEAESLNAAMVPSLFAHKKRLKRFLMEKRMIDLIKNFMNNFNSIVYQKDLKDPYFFNDEVKIYIRKLYK